MVDEVGQGREDLEGEGEGRREGGMEGEGGRGRESNKLSSVAEFTRVLLSPYTHNSSLPLLSSHYYLLHGLKGWRRVLVTTQVRQCPRHIT